MKLVMVTRSFDHQIGGMESHTRLLAEHWIARGWDVTVITPRVDGEPVFKLNGLTIIRTGPKPSSLIKYSPLFWWQVRWQLLHLGDETDVIVNISMAIGGSLFLPQRLRHKIVSIAHGTYRMERQTLISAIKAGDRSPKILLGIPYTYLFQLVQRYVNNLSAKIICISQGVFDDLIRERPRLAPKTFLIRNFIDLAVFKPTTRTGAPAQNYIELLFLARLHREKGPLILLHSLAALKTSRPQVYNKIMCKIIGDGPDRSIAESLAVELGVNDHVHFVGPVNAADVPQMMGVADIYIFPTLRQEGLPFSLMEAMASALPVIASDVPGPQELIEDGKSGLLVPPNDEAALTEAIYTLATQRQYAHALGVAARNRIELDFEAHKQLSKIDALLGGDPAKNASRGQE